MDVRQVDKVALGESQSMGARQNALSITVTFSLDILGPCWCVHDTVVYY